MERRGNMQESNTEGYQQTTNCTVLQWILPPCPFQVQLAIFQMIITTCSWP